VLALVSENSVPQVPLVPVNASESAISTPMQESF
jgi:hypothetical protein